MQLWEINFLSNEIPYSFQTSWEQTRIISLMIAQKFVKKRLKLKDIFTLPSEQDNTDYYELTDEELEQNKQLQKNLEDYLNNQNKQIKQ